MMEIVPIRNGFLVIAEVNDPSGWEFHKNTDSVIDAIKFAFGAPEPPKAEKKDSSSDDLFDEED